MNNDAAALGYGLRRSTMEYMSTIYLNPRTTGPPRGHRLGEVLRAVRIYVRTAFGVAVLGEYAEEVGVIRTRR